MPTVTPFGESKTTSVQQDWWTLLHPIRLAMDSLSTHEMFMNNTPQVTQTGAQSVPYTVSPHMTPMNKDSAYPPTAQSTAAKSPTGYYPNLSDTGLPLPNVAQVPSEQAMGVPPPSTMPPAQTSVPLPAQHPSAAQTRQTVCAPPITHLFSIFTHITWTSVYTGLCSDDLPEPGGGAGQAA